mgnify:CR=1 FL=1
MINDTNSFAESSDSHDNEIKLLDLILVLANHWRMIFYFTVVTSIIAACIAFIMPNSYQAKAIIMTFQRQSILPLSASIKDAGIVAGIPKTTFHAVSMPILLDMLQSDKTLQELSKQFNMPSTKLLKSHLKTKFSKSGALEITMEDSDPKRAVAIANAACDELGRVAYAANLVSTPLITLERDFEKLTDNDILIIKSIQVATPPEKKSGPKRLLIILLSTITVLFFSVFLAFLIEYFRNLSDDDRVRLCKVKAAFRGRNTDKAMQEQK